MDKRVSRKWSDQRRTELCGNELEHKMTSYEDRTHHDFAVKLFVIGLTSVKSHVNTNVEVAATSATRFRDLLYFSECSLIDKLCQCELNIFNFSVFCSSSCSVW